MDGAEVFLDRLGHPFLFAEERILSVTSKNVRSFYNSLPKVLFFLEGEIRHQFDSGEILYCEPGSVMVQLSQRRQTYYPVDEDRASRIRVMRVTFAENPLTPRRRGDDFLF